MAFNPPQPPAAAITAMITAATIDSRVRIMTFALLSRRRELVTY